MSARWPLVVLLAALIVAAIVAGPAFTQQAPCTKYASTSGVDSPTNGSFAAPYRTAGFLASNLAANEVGCLRGYPADSAPENKGLYEENNVTISSPNITLRSYPGEVAQLKGRLKISAANVTVSHLVLDGRNSGNLSSPFIDGPGDGAQLTDNVITTRSTGNCVAATLQPPSTGTVDNLTIRHNRIHDCTIAILLEYSQYATVSDNLIYDNKGAAIRFGPAADTSAVYGNVMERSFNGVVFGTGADFNYITGNVLSNPKNFTLTYLTPTPPTTPPTYQTPGNYNAFVNNCVWSAGGSGINTAHTSSSPFDAGKIYISGNVTANPGYNGATSEGSPSASEGSPPASTYTLPSGNGCRPTVSDMSAAVTDGERPKPAQEVNLRPNVLFIVTDDQRADTMDMGVLPQTLSWFETGTPSDSSFHSIRGGTAYKQGFVTTPLCCPSRASIFSGRFVHSERHQVGTLFDAEQLYAESMLPWYLKQGGLGYYSGMYGKYLNAWSNCSGGSNKKHVDAQGATAGTPPNFDEYGVVDENQYLDFSARETPNGTCLSHPDVPTPNPAPGPDAPDPSEYEHTTSYVFKKGREFLHGREQANDSQPWFLYLATTAPHERGESDNWPGPPQEHDERWGQNAWQQMTAGTATPPPNSTPYDQVQPTTPAVPPLEPDRDDKPSPSLGRDSRTFYEVSGVRGLQKQQLRTLMFLDQKLDPFMRKLEDTAEADDTLAFFISDNGYLWREHGEVAGDCINPNSPSAPEGGPTYTNNLCGITGKGRPYIEAVKIPFFMRWPDNPNVAANHEEPEKPVATIDMTTTAMDAIDKKPDDFDGPTVDDPFDGRSLLTPYTREWMLIEWPEGGNFRWNALVNAHERYTKYYTFHRAITAVSNPNGGAVTITVPGHTAAIGEHIAISGVTGQTSLNATWAVASVVAGNTITLSAATGDGVASNGGTVTDGVLPRDWYELYKYDTDPTERDSLFGPCGYAGPQVPPPPSIEPDCDPNPSDDPNPAEYESKITQYRACEGTLTGDPNNSCP